MTIDQNIDHYCHFGVGMCIQEVSGEKISKEEVYLRDEGAKRGNPGNFRRQSIPGTDSVIVRGRKVFGL